MLIFAWILVLFLALVVSTWCSFPLFELNSCVYNRMLLMPYFVVQLCERLPSPNGESAVDCNSLSSMPNVAFTISNKTFELKPEEVSICYICLDILLAYLILRNMYSLIFVVL